MVNPAEGPDLQHEIQVGEWKIRAGIHGNATEVEYVDIPELLGQMERDLLDPQRNHQFEIGLTFNPTLREATLLDQEHATLTLVQGNLILADRGSRHGTFISTTEDPQAHRLKRGGNLTGTLNITQPTEIYLPLQKDTAGKTIYLKLDCDKN